MRSQGSFGSSASIWYVQLVHEIPGNFSAKTALSPSIDCCASRLATARSRDEDLVFLEAVGRRDARYVESLLRRGRARRTTLRVQLQQSTR